MRASIANADYGVRERPLAFFSGNNELGQMNKGRTGRNSRAAFQRKTPVLLSVWLVRFGLWLRLICRGLFGCAWSAGLRLRNQQHPRPAVQMHVLSR